MKLKQLLKAAHRFAEPYCVTDGGKFRLKDVDPADTGELSSEDKPAAKEGLAMGVEALIEMQHGIFNRSYYEETLADILARVVEYTLTMAAFSAVLVPTRTGNTARMISRFKPNEWVVALS